MEVETKAIGDIDVLKLAGRLDADSTGYFKEKVSFLAEHNRVRLVIDMSAMTFIDSSGLGAIISALRLTRESGGNIKIAALQAPIRPIFKLTHLDRVFDLYGDTETALEKFQG